MLKWFTRFSLKNSAVVFIAMIMVIVGGIYSYFTIPNAEYPDVDIPWIHVNITYPGATPQQVYDDIGKVLEPKFSTIDGLQKLYAFSSTGNQEFDLEVSMDRKNKDVDTDIQNILSGVKLPDSASKPDIQNDTISGDAALIFSVSSNTADIQDIQYYVENTLKPALTAVSGVGDVVVNGSTKKNIYVQLNTTSMKDKGITWQQIQQALVANNFSAPIGTMNSTTTSMPIVVGGTLQSLDALRNVPVGLSLPKQGATAERLPVAPTTANVVHLGDIATVAYKDDPTNESITRTNGKPGVVVRIIPAAHANTIQVVKDVNAALSSVKLPSGYHTDELMNASDTVKTSVDGMIREAALGALFATIVTLLFLRDLRATIVALFSIPLSIFAAIIVITQMGYSLNLLTLSGIAVAVGRVVDDSIVVIENIYRRLKIRNGSGDTALVTEATHEVGAAVTSSTITTIAVFAPMTVIPGIVGHVFAPFAWTVIIALAFSLLVALMVVPLIARISLLKVKPTAHKENALQRGYRRALAWSLKRKWIVLVLSLVLLAESGFAATKIGFNFLPSGRTDMYVVGITMPTASSMESANKVSTQVEDILTNDDGVKTFQSFVDAHSPSVYVMVKDSVKDTDAFANDLRNRLKQVTGAKRISVAGNSGPSDPTVHLMLQGADYNQLRTVADQAETALSKISGLTDVSTSVQASMPQAKVNVDATKAATYGLDPMQVAGAIRNMVNGATVMNVSYNGRTTDVNLQLGSDGVTSMQQLQDEELLTPMGTNVKLSDIATVTQVTGPTSISRLNQQQFIQVTGTIVSNNASAVTASVNKAMSDLHLPAGVTYSQEGASQDMNTGFKNMGIAMLVSFLLVLVVMLITFGEWAAPLAIVFALPFAIVGGMNGLWLTHQPLGMPGMIGFMMLIGIIVTNAIVLMDRVERNMKQGLSVRESLLEAGTVRLRPILMTATATIGALIPLAMTSDGGLISKTLAIVVIGGLITSTILTLVIVPIMYEWFTAIRARVFRKQPHAKTSHQQTVLSTQE